MQKQKTIVYSGKYDQVFLSIVTFDNDYLKEIIYEVLNIKVKKAKIINSKMAKKRIMSRASYLDLVVETEIGYINIEVSNDSYNKYSAHRNFIYLINLIQNVTTEGMKLKEMPKVYQINLIFGNNNNTSIDKYNLCSLMTRKILTKKIEIYNVYIDKLKEIYYNNNNKLTSKPAILALNMTLKELEERKNENMFYEKLYAKLDEMEDTGIAPEIMDIEEEKKWYRQMLIESARDEGLEQGLEQGIEQGTQQSRLEIVLAMLRKGFDIKLISEITTLGLEEINLIKTNNKR